MEQEGRREEEVRELELERSRCSNQMMRYLNVKKIVCESSQTIPGMKKKACTYLTNMGGKELLEKDADSCFPILMAVESPIKKIILEEEYFCNILEHPESTVGSRTPKFLQAIRWD